VTVGIQPKVLLLKEGDYIMKTFYYIKYEFENKPHGIMVQPDENPMYRLISLTDAGAKIIHIEELKVR
jgi:hypothetical protein